MNLKTIAKKILKKLDQCSPYPLFYQILMSKNEKALFDKEIQKSQHYLEFGLGGSTLYAIQKSKATIYTVESSPEWIHDIQQYYLVRHFENKRLYIFYVDIGPVCSWGYPKSDSFKECFEAYSSHIFQLIDSKLLDLTLIDGRFRVACTLKTILKCHKNHTMKILIHDFWDRPYYQVVLKYLDIVNGVDTMVLFSIKKDIDLRSVEKDYEIYKFNPK